MSFSRRFTGVLGLVGFAVAITASQPVAKDRTTVDVAGKGDRHDLRVVAEAVPATAFVTVEQRFPDEGRSVLTRVPRVAVAAN